MVKMSQALKNNFSIGNWKKQLKKKKKNIKFCSKEKKQKVLESMSGAYLTWAFQKSQ